MIRSFTKYFPVLQVIEEHRLNLWYWQTFTDKTARWVAVPDEVWTMWAVTCLPTNVMVKVKDTANDPHARFGECLPFLNKSLSFTDCGAILN